MEDFKGYEEYEPLKLFEEKEEPKEDKPENENFNGYKLILVEGTLPKKQSKPKTKFRDILKYKNLIIS